MNAIVPIIIPTFNAVHYLRRCIQTVEGCTKAPYQLHIVDDCSPSSALHNYLDELVVSGRAIVFKKRTRLGFGSLLNWAMKQVPPSECILLLNSDIEATPGWLAAMLQEIEDDPQVGIVGARLIYPDTKEPAKRLTIQHAGVARTADVSPYHPFRGELANYAPAAKRREINAVTAACTLIRRSVWDQVGGFDDKYLGGQYEDVDFCWFARELGWKVIYQPGATLYHYEHGSGEKEAFRHVARNRQRLQAKWAKLDSDEHLFVDEPGGSIWKSAGKRFEPTVVSPPPKPPDPPVQGAAEEPEIVEVPTVVAVEELESIPIIIPTYNAVEHLRRCVLSLLHYTEAPFKIYIADDCSPNKELHRYLDGLEAIGRATVLRREKRGGFAEINNWAVEQIPPSSLICLLNSDIEVTQPWLAHMLQEMLSDQLVGIVGARLLYPKTKEAPWGGTIQHAGVARTDLGYPTHVFRGEEPSYKQASVRREINAVTGACMLIRRELWDQLGGFDEGFVGGQFEDVHLCWTSRRLGWKVVYQPKATLLHYEHGSGEEWVEQASAKNCERLRKIWQGIKGDEYLFQ